MVVIKIHSFIDIITNSSTEIFVSATDRSISCAYDLLDIFTRNSELKCDSRVAFDIVLKPDYKCFEYYFRDAGFDSKEEYVNFLYEEDLYTNNIIITAREGYEQYQYILDNFSNFVLSLEAKEVSH